MLTLIFYQPSEKDDLILIWPILFAEAVNWQKRKTTIEKIKDSEEKVNSPGS